MKQNSVGGARYFITFIDDFTRMIFVYFMKTKDQAFEKFLIFKSYVECQTGKTIKAIRNDNGKEYVNKKFDDFLIKCGIKHQLTVSYTPQQNGVAERANRTLVEMARCMLVHTKTQENLWAEAVNTAAYLRNRCITRALDNITPYEAWYKRKPVVAHLKVFGSRVFALEKTERNKFHAKGKEYMFVGYSSNSKAYRLFDVDTMKIKERRDVKFLEDIDKNTKNNETTETPNFDLSILPLTPNNNCTNIADITHEDTYIESENESSHEQIFANENDLSDIDGAASDEGDVANTKIIERKRGGGRPRIVRTGAPGRPRKVYQMLNLSAESESSFTPRNVKEALTGKHSKYWQESMKAEYDALILNETWSLVDLPPEQNAIGTKWVFRIKRNENGEIQKFKSRLVAQGCNQIFGLNYWETFSPVIRYENIRLLFAIAVEKNLFLHQLDVSNAYLNGQLDEEIYLKQPEGFINNDHPHKVLRLHKAIYGLKQSGRIWNEVLNNTLLELGFNRCTSEPCLYISKSNEENLCLIAVYVDDIIIACADMNKINILKLKLTEKFKVHDCGTLKHFLGMEIKRDGDIGNIYVGHHQYIRDILTNYNMNQCRPVATPLDPGFKIKCLNESCKRVNVTSYQSLIGSLMYLAITTRPDILFAVCLLAQKNSDPHTEHQAAAFHILRYLYSTINLNLCFSRTNKSIQGFVDADWAGNSDDRKSYSGYVFFFGNSLVSWNSKKQSVVALSSTEAEYIALSNAAKEAIYLKRVCAEIGLPCNDPIILNGDNLSSHQLATNNVNNKRTKHIDIRYHFVRDCITKNQISLKYVPTDENIADQFTKLLNKQKHKNFVNMLGLSERS